MHGLRSRSLRSERALRSRVGFPIRRSPAWREVGFARCLQCRGRRPSWDERAVHDRAHPAPALGDGPVISRIPARRRRVAAFRRRSPVGLSAVNETMQNVSAGCSPATNVTPLAVRRVGGCPGRWTRRDWPVAHPVPARPQHESDAGNSGSPRLWATQPRKPRTVHRAPARAPILREPRPARIAPHGRTHVRRRLRTRAMYGRRVGRGRPRCRARSSANRKSWMKTPGTAGPRQDGAGAGRGRPG